MARRSCWGRLVDPSATGEALTLPGGTGASQRRRSPSPAPQGQTIDDVHAMRWHLVLHLKADAASLRAARKLVRVAAQLAGASDFEAAEVELATGEALTHAYEHVPAGGAGSIEIDLVAAASEFKVTVRHQGRTMTPPVLPSAPPSPSDLRAWRWYVMYRLVDGLDVQVTNSGEDVAVHMSKRLTAAGGASSAIC